MPFSRNLYFSALEQGRLWSPRAWRPSFWLDAADLSTLTLVNGDVSEWRDKSGFGRHVSQATAADRPTYRAFGLNGFPTLDWGSAINNKRLNNENISNWSPKKFFVAAQYDGPNPAAQYYSLLSTDFTRPTFNGLYWIAILNLGGTNWFNDTHYLNGASSPSFDAIPAISNPFVLATNSVMETDLVAIDIGFDRGDFNRGWVGKISEVFAVDFEPSLHEIQRAVGYLTWKWGRQQGAQSPALDARHPFTKRPPLIGD